MPFKRTYPNTAHHRTTQHGGPAIQAISLSVELPRDGYKSLFVCGRVGPHEGDMFYLAERKGVHPMSLIFWLERSLWTGT
jgi:hypothetical protein